MYRDAHQAADLLSRTKRRVSAVVADLGHHRREGRQAGANTTSEHEAEPISPFLPRTGPAGGDRLHRRRVRAPPRPTPAYSPAHRSSARARCLSTLPSAIPAAGTSLTLPTVDLILEPPTGVDRARLAVPRAAKAFAIDRAYGDYYAPDFPTLADIARAALADIDPMPRSTTVLAFATVTDYRMRPDGFPVIRKRLCWVFRDTYVEWYRIVNDGTPPPWPYPPTAEADISLIDAPARPPAV